MEDEVDDLDKGFEMLKQAYKGEYKLPLDLKIWERRGMFPDYPELEKPSDETKEDFFKRIRLKGLQVLEG